MQCKRISCSLIVATVLVLGSSVLWAGENEGDETTETKAAPQEEVDSKAPPVETVEQTNIKSKGSFDYAINPSLLPKTVIPGRWGERPVAAYKDPSGAVAKFIANEIEISTTDRAVLQAFLARHPGARVVSDNKVPEPPPDSGIKMDPKYRIPTSFLVRIDPSSMDLNRLGSEAGRLGVTGRYEFSDEMGAKLLIVVCEEFNRGVRVFPNVLLEPNSLLLQSREVRTDTEGTEERYLSAFDLIEFSARSLHRAGVDKAWQLKSLVDTSYRPKIAIVDTGFGLSADGSPILDEYGRSDYPDHPSQYNFVNDSYHAGGGANEECASSGRTDAACIWHGNRVSSIALGTFNNLSGATGTGGQVADPILLRPEIGVSSVTRALRTAAAWHADILVLAQSADIGGFLSYLYRRSSIPDAMGEVAGAGALIVAGTGEAGTQADVNTVPCTDPHVHLCVGSLDGANSNRAANFSDFGPEVRLWAPTYIRTMKDPMDRGAVLPYLYGTSASSPYVAGVAAMMKAVNPSLRAGDLRRILLETSWTDFPDPKVGHSINAYGAVLAAANGRIRSDRFENNNTPETATPIPNIPDYTERDLTLHDASDVDYFSFSLSDYTTVQLDLDFMSLLGSVNAEIIPRSSGGGIGVPLPRRTVTPNHLRIEAPNLGIGDYLIRITGGGGQVNGYNLVYTRLRSGLIADAFEPNNPFSEVSDHYWDHLDRSYRNDFWNHPVDLTFHTDTDEDYYVASFFRRCVIDNPFVTAFEASVPYSSVPVRLSLYAANHQATDEWCRPSTLCDSVWGRIAREVGSSDSGRLSFTFSDPDHTSAHYPGLDLLRDFGFWQDDHPYWTSYLKVESRGGRGIYQLRLQCLLDPAVVRSLSTLNNMPDQIFYLTPEGPRPYWLGEKNGLFGFEQKGDLSQLTLTGMGVHATLLDRQGKILAQGESFTDAQGSPGERIKLDQTAKGTLYLVQVSRATAPAELKGQTQSLESLYYVLNLEKSVGKTK